MGKWLHKTKLQVLDSISPTSMRERFGGVFTDNNGKAASNADWEYQPDMSAVEGWEAKYWERPGDTVLLMDADARDVVDAAEKEASDTARVDELDNVLARTLLEKINVLETNAGIKNTTFDEIKTEAKAKL